jgi:hypothetical protein
MILGASSNTRPTPKQVELCKAVITIIKHRSNYNRYTHIAQNSEKYIGTNALHKLQYPNTSLTQHNTTRHDTTQHNTTHHNTAQHNTTQHNTTQHNTSQHITTQHNTAQHSTTHYNTTHCCKEISDARMSTYNLEHHANGEVQEHEMINEYE